MMISISMMMRDQIIRIMMRITLIMVKGMMNRVERRVSLSSQKKFSWTALTIAEENNNGGGGGDD